LQPNFQSSGKRKRKAIQSFAKLPWVKNFLFSWGQILPIDTMCHWIHKCT